ncbi:MAG: energy transducer TonB [Bacteroidia bacterium]
MKNKILPLGISVFISLCGFAQTQSSMQDSTASKKDTVRFFTSTQSPQFKGDGGLPDYLSSNLNYPKEEMILGIQGKVYVNFIVELDGSVSNVRIKQGVPDGPGLDKEAMRVIYQMPAWKPGMLNGQPARIEMTQPITFSLKNNKRIR